MSKYGVNDMPRGWIVESEWNKRVYQLWMNMLVRCYNKKYHEKQPTYIECEVCERWLYLSNFVEDIVKIDNYEYWLSHPNERVALDKDIKSNNQNKCYCLEQCQFITIEENTRQANKKTRSEEAKKKISEAKKGKNHPNLGQLVARYSLDGELIDIKYNFEFVEMGFDRGNISHCCKGKVKTHKGFIFKYHEE